MTTYSVQIKKLKMYKKSLESDAVKIDDSGLFLEANNIMKKVNEFNEKKQKEHEDMMKALEDARFNDNLRKQNDAEIFDIMESEEDSNFYKSLAAYEKQLAAQDIEIVLKREDDVKDNVKDNGKEKEEEEMDDGQNIDNEAPPKKLVGIEAMKDNRGFESMMASIMA